MATLSPRRGRKPLKKLLWTIAKPGETVATERNYLSWADAMDVLDIDPEKTLVVQAKTYKDARSMQASAAKAASRRYMGIVVEWDGEWLRITSAA